MGSSSPFGATRYRANWHAESRTARDPRGAHTARTAADLLRAWTEVPVAIGLRRHALVAIEKLVVHCATETVAVSESIRTVLQRDGIGAGRSVTVIGWGSAQGVDLDVFLSRVIPPNDST